MPPANTKIISLQRKLSTAIFIVLVIVLCGLEYLSFQRNMQNHREAVLENIERSKTTFSALLQDSYSEIFRIADSYNIQNLQAKSLARFAQPSLLAGIESVRFFSADGKNLLNHDANGSLISSSLPESITQALQQVAKTQHPTGFIDCRQQCLQKVFVPIIANNGSELIVNINRNSNLLIQDFYDLTHIDIAILTKENRNSPTIESLLLASNAAENRNRILPLLEKITNQGTKNNAFFGKLHDNYYSAKRFYIDSPLTPSLEVLVYTQENGTQKLINGEIRDTMLTLCLTLLFSMAAITLILRPPLKKILELANLLKLLPQGDFTSAKSQLSHLKRNKLHRDETDVLKESLGNVINDLEQLNQQSVNHQETLQQKITELTEATQFNDMLLDSSPLIILIHDSFGNIHSINALGRELIGPPAKAGEHRNINEWIRSDFQQRSLSETLAVLLHDNGKSIQGEMPLFNKDGLRIEVLWVHRSIRIKGQTRILSMGMDITEQHEAMRSLQWLGRHDRVTGLLNRLSFIEEVKNHIAEASKEAQFDLILIDIDNFAKFNDRFDFSTGDKLLLELARNISLALPDGCLLARSGSGEFMALLDNSATINTADDKESFNALTRYNIETESGTETIQLSIVVNHISQDRNIGVDQLISDTTALMAQVKKKSKGQVFLATEEHIDRISRQEKYHMKDLLQRALEENRLLLFYQPIVNIRNKKVSHCECLVRLLDEQGQFIPPFKFLGVAAELGLMSQIDFAVIEMAMQQQKRWQDQGVDIGLSINLTAHTMELPDFEQQLKSLIDSTEANPKKLIFEVVETDALENIDEANILLRNFKSIGAKIALDDFGVGFTSFEYIRELPVDFIKIDQSFVRFIHERPNDQALVRSMIDMSHSLNKQVIVEGIETAEAMEIIKEMGAEYAQGYYLSRPMPLDALNLEMSLTHLL
jgi:diguanylate cyclase (GGDEF)-like protein/PAS domain S-box-containing protein